MSRSQVFAAGFAVLSLSLAGPVLSPASAQYGRGGYDRAPRLEGQRFEVMRSLAHFLDEGVQFTLEDATNALTDSRNARDRDFLDSLRRLAQRTDSFHDRLDSYAANPWDVATEVRVLLTEGRRINSRMQRMSAMRDLYDDWAAVVDDLNRMQRLMAGQDVQVPSAHPEWAEDAGGHHHDHNGRNDGDRNGYPGRRNDAEDYRSGPFNGQDLDDMRRLAHELDTQARRALGVAERSTSDASGRGAQMLGDLRHFVERTAALHDRTDADRLDRRDFGPMVGHLLEDARSADRSMRQARVFSDAWDEWQQTIGVLERLDAAVRR